MLRLYAFDPIFLSFFAPYFVQQLHILDEEVSEEEAEVFLNPNFLADFQNVADKAVDLIFEPSQGVDYSEEKEQYEYSPGNDFDVLFHIGSVFLAAKNYSAALLFFERYAAKQSATAWGSAVGKHDPHTLYNIALCKIFIAEQEVFGSNSMKSQYLTSAKTKLEAIVQLLDSGGLENEVLEANETQSTLADCKALLKLTRFKDIE